GVAELSNMEVLQLRNAEAGAPRLQALAATLGVASSALAYADIETAFGHYYASGANSGSLQAFATLLARVVRGELLSQASTALLLEHMQQITTGDHRLRAGLDDNVAFAQ